jgi:copper chaperone CopZ
MQKIIDVDGITCDHCVATIKKSIESLAGIIKVNVDIQNQQVIVDFNESLKNSKKILEKIGEAGFEVRK